MPNCFIHLFNIDSVEIWRFLVVCGGPQMALQDGAWFVIFTACFHLTAAFNHFHPMFYLNFVGNTFVFILVRVFFHLLKLYWGNWLNWCIDLIAYLGVYNSTYFFYFSVLNYWFSSNVLFELCWTIFVCHYSTNLIEVCWLITNKINLFKLCFDKRSDWCIDLTAWWWMIHH